MAVSARIFLFIFSFVFTSIFSQNKWNIRYYHEIEGREAVIYADNEEWMPMSTKFSFKLNNMSSSLPDGTTVVIPAKSKKIEVARLTPIKPNAANGFKYDMSINFGNVHIEKYDDDYQYWLPFEKGRTQLIFQGYNGNFSHQNTLALDFNLKNGDPVHAAREGLVTEVVTKNTKSCPDISCAKYNNYILIMHSDGTFAVYSHLKLNGAAVKPGDTVEKGALIGYSGNTGFSNGPHLHFSVFINSISGERRYIKTKFRTSLSENTVLQEKKSYTRDY